MAVTPISTASEARKIRYFEKLFRETRIDSYFSRFFGSDENSVVQEIRELEKDKGDKLIIGLIARLLGEGVTGNTPLHGSEEKLQHFTDSFELELYRNGVEDDGYFARKRPFFDLPSAIRMQLKTWGSEKMDKLIYNALIDSPTTVWYPEDSAGTMTRVSDINTAIGDISEANSKFTLDHVRLIKAWATTGGGRTQTPIRPVKYNGKNYFIMLVHPDHLYDLKGTEKYEQAQQNAQVRGDGNPLFTGAEALWDGVVIHEWEGVEVGTNGGTGGNQAYGKCLFMGAQACALGHGVAPEIIEEKRDYQEFHGYAYRMVMKAHKPKLASSGSTTKKDYGVINCVFARTNIAGS